MTPASPLAERSLNRTIVLNDEVSRSVPEAVEEMIIKTPIKKQGKILPATKILPYMMCY
jgi:hypothetical protein